jgi:hypothetical protein
LGFVPVGGAAAIALISWGISIVPSSLLSSIAELDLVINGQRLGDKSTIPLP